VLLSSASADFPELQSFKPRNPKGFLGFYFTIPSCSSFAVFLTDFAFYGADKDFRV